jgi:cellulose synthase/poly-beta-1,6-N-acetylglucosamine synthase-like glycosyltransferase
VEALRVVLGFAVVVLVLVLAVLAAASLAALLKGCFELRRSLRATSYDFDSVLLKSPIVPGISVIYVPPDASPESRAMVRRLLDLHAGRHELVLVLDGPEPMELERWVREFHLLRQERVVPEDVPSAAIRGCYLSSDPIRLLVVDKQPGGVADALNAGVNAAQYPVIGLVDGEAEFIPEFLLRLIRPMLGDWDRTVAVCGVAPPPAAPGLAGRIGAIEWLRLWLARCAALSAWNKLLPVPGACMLVKRDAVGSVGGFRAGPLDLFLDLHAAGSANGLRWRIALLAAPVSFRPAAATWGDLRRQAIGDQRQLAAALRRLGTGANREFLGLFSIRVLRPLLETAAYILAAAGWVAGLLHPALAALVLLTSVGAGIAISLAAVVLRELAEPSGMAPASLAALCLAAIPENLGYRQIRNFWLIAGFFGAPAVQKQKRGHAAQDRAPAMETRKK